MNTMQNFYSMGSIFLLLFWTIWWFKLIVLLIITTIALIFHFIKVKRLKHEKADIERQLLERNELLQYSKLAEQKANEKASDCSSSKTVLLSRVNHEIRTPMNGVLGMASLLDQTDLTEEQKEYTSTILTSGKALLGVVNEIMMNDILEYSKIDSGKELEAKELDLCNCIEEVFDVFAAKAARAGIDLLYYVEPNVPGQVVGDVRRLRQILMNLIDNSIKATSKGEIYIGVQLLECKEDNRLKLEFEVRDTGAGISVDKANQLSSELSATNLSVNNNAVAGLGLMICKRLTELMGGSLSFTSSENCGTTFRFTIYTKAGMQTFRKHVHSSITALEDKRILIVESNQLAAELLKKKLENLKMITSSAASGNEALEILTQVSFDLVITALNLTGMDGIQLTECITKKYPNLPVILLNTVNDERYKQYANIFGEVVYKPVKQHLLQNAVLNLFRHKNDEPANKQTTIHKLSENFSIQYPLAILIAEDNPINQKWTTKTLSKLGYQTEVVANGKEVLDIVSRKNYDLILMDIQMPEMDGMEATRMIRLCLDTQPVIIAMTANAMQGDRQDCMAAGMDDYISKPVDLNELVGMLEKWAVLIKEKRQPGFLLKN